MRIMKLTPDTYEPMEATLTNNKKDKDHLQYTIMHGSFPKRGIGTWGIKIYLSRRVFPVTNDEQNKTITLDKENYFILPLKGKEKELLTDKRGNKLYYITESKDTSILNNHDIVFWYIPICSNDISITYEGNVKEVLRGMFGEVNFDIVYKAPAPILDISGDCKLIYKYTDNNVEYTHTYEFDQKENKWSRNTNAVRKEV